MEGPQGRSPRRASAMSNHGCVYALLNEGMGKDLVKIGMAGVRDGSGAVESAVSRIRELGASTAAPVPFSPLIVVAVDDAKRMEEILHLSFSRLNDRREFFVVPGADDDQDAQVEFRDTFRGLCEKVDPGAEDVTDLVCAILDGRADPPAPLLKALDPNRLLRTAPRF